MNSKLRIALLCTVLGVPGLPAAALAQAAGPEAPVPAEVTELYRKGNQAYDHGDLKGARELYLRAWALQKSYTVASNLGAVELDLGHPRAAAQFLTYALEQLPARAKGSRRALLESRLKQATSLIGTLLVDVGEPGANLFVDGDFIGISPIGSGLFVDAGAHSVTVKLEGFKDTEQAIDVRAGQTLPVSFKLEKAPAPRLSSAPGAVIDAHEVPPPDGAAAPAPLASAKGKRSSAIPLALGATSIVALGTGLTLLGLAESNRAEAQSLHDQLQGANGGCASPSAKCDELHSHSASADTFGNLGIGALALAGTAAAGAITYVFWPASAQKPAPREAATFGVSATPEGGGVQIHGTF